MHSSLRARCQRLMSHNGLMFDDVGGGPLQRLCMQLVQKVVHASAAKGCACIHPNQKAHILPRSKGTHPAVREDMHPAVRDDTHPAAMRRHASSRNERARIQPR
eukprot:360121-Chlamydomonas_euryale.AAC.29